MKSYLVWGYTLTQKAREQKDIEPIAGPLYRVDGKRNPQWARHLKGFVLVLGPLRISWNGSEEE